MAPSRSLLRGLARAAALCSKHQPHEQQQQFFAAARALASAACQPPQPPQHQHQQTRLLTTQPGLLPPQQPPLDQHQQQPCDRTWTTSWQHRHSHALAGAHRLSSFGRSLNTTSSSSSGSSNAPSESGSSASVAAGKDMAIVFTCAKCDTRAVKAFSRHSYEKGLVLVRCPGCQSLHLIADHLGWFGDASFKIDEYLAAQGQAVKRVSLDADVDGSQGGVSGQPASSSSSSSAGPPQQQQQESLSPEDVAGWSKVQQLLSTVAAASGPGAAADARQEEGAAAECALGVVQVEPADVAAWVRVQQQQQRRRRPEP